MTCPTVARALLASLLVLVYLQPRARTQPGRGRDLSTGSIIVCRDSIPDVIPDAEQQTPMLLNLAGVAAILRGDEYSRRLSACSLPPDRPGESVGFAADVPGAVRVWLLDCRRATESKRIEVLQTAASTLVTHELDPSGKPTPLVNLRADRFRDLAAAWPAYRGPFAPSDPPPAVATVVEVQQPYVAGPFTLDHQTISERLARGLPTNLQASTRTLSNESLLARLPRGYDPRARAGLLVWVDASPDGRPPDAFAPALDELGIICIGAANSGNNRLAVDRDQLALDAVATASARWHIDPRRIYVTGISGGGRISSILAGCFPDVFTGSIPIVGLGVYTKGQLPAPEIGKFVRAAYEHPDPKLFAVFRKRRLAAITGPQDMNFGEISEAVRILKNDGVPARCFSYDDMGHELPTPERFLEALRWVDEPYQEARRKETDLAQRLLDVYLAQFGDKSPSTPAQRSALVKITDAGPWTPAAWRAAQLLGATPSLPGVPP